MMIIHRLINRIYEWHEEKIRAGRRWALVYLCSGEKRHRYAYYDGDWQDVPTIKPGDFPLAILCFDTGIPIDVKPVSWVNQQWDNLTYTPTSES